MHIVEIRDLDGPNLFLLEPAIKVELGGVRDADLQSVSAKLEDTIRRLHSGTNQPDPQVMSTPMETPGHLTVAYSWQKRAFATAMGTWAAELVTGERYDEDHMISELREILLAEPEDDDAPLMIRDEDRSIPIVAITGTNGKTTTSRLIASVLKFLGHKAGLTSSSGVYIDKELVLAGDYSGPSGARRVFAEPDVEFAVLETARGGMLLRGCGFEHSDVSVITNVTEDHLGLHGIHSIEGLANVKRIIARVVKPGGFCVLNGDDERVLAMKHDTPGTPVLFSRRPDNDAVTSHIAEGGAALVVAKNGDFVWYQGGQPQVITNVSDIPMTFNGKATHQVENALAATGALIGLGIVPENIREGLRAFRSTASDSKGRLNVYEVNGATVIIDFAHNEVGLTHLLNFAHGQKGAEGKVIAVIGTAGDRDDNAFRGIARRAVENADVVVLKDSVHYLRGREPGEMLALMREGAASAGRPEVDVLEAPEERSATLMMIDRLKPGDVLAVMCVEDSNDILEYMDTVGSALA